MEIASIEIIINKYKNQKNKVIEKVIEKVIDGIDIYIGTVGIDLIEKVIEKVIEEPIKT